MFFPTCDIYIYVIDSPSCASYGDQSVELIQATTSCTPKKLRDWNLNKRIWMYPSVKLTWQWKITELSVKNCHIILVLWSISQLAMWDGPLQVRMVCWSGPVARPWLNDGDSVGWGNPWLSNSRKMPQDFFQCDELFGYWFEPSDVIKKRKFTLEFGLMSICLFKVGAWQSCFQQYVVILVMRSCKYHVFVQT